MNGIFFHTFVNILWIIILTAFAAIAISVAYVVVKVIFFKGKSNGISRPQMYNEKE